MIKSPENMNDWSLQNENSAPDTTQIAGLSKVVEKKRKARQHRASRKVEEV